MSKTGILWFIFLLDLVVNIIYFTDDRILSRFSVSSPLDTAFLLLPVILLLLHASCTLSVNRSLLFIILASGLGFTSEFLGLKTGVIFGGSYTYHMDGPSILGVPVSVVFYWAVFIYFGYSFVNSFLLWQGQPKPDFASHRPLHLLPLVILDAWIVVAIDLFMDPLQVKAGNWSWQGGGSYFGIPVGNFLGWFFVVFLTTGTFRLFEYFWPHKVNVGKSVYLIPVVGYLTMVGVFSLLASRLGLTGLIPFGLMSMLPLVLLNLLFLIRHRVFLYPSAKIGE